MIYFSEMNCEKFKQKRVFNSQVMIDLQQATKKNTLVESENVCHIQINCLFSLRIIYIFQKDDWSKIEGKNGQFSRIATKIMDNDLHLRSFGPFAWNLVDFFTSSL